MPDVLIIDDDPDFVDLVTVWCEQEGFHVTSAPNARRGLELVKERAFAAILLDMYMPERSGLDMLEDLGALRHAPPVVFVSASSDVRLVVEAMKRGARDYVTKPLRRTDVLTTLRNVIDEHDGTDDDAARHDFCGMIGASPSMERVFAEIERVGPSDLSVLIRGESGTGKELAARALHTTSRRAERPFVPVNCAAIAEGLEESELFGHARGSFTGATGSRQGLFEQADGGTLFLDEIGDLRAGAQAKLLRVLQDGTFQRVGETQVRRTDVRVIAATHRDLESAIGEGTFRADLLFRLSTFVLTLPPLRDRDGDVRLLATRFLEASRRSLGRPELHFAPDVLPLLEQHDWPGNVRELESAIRRAGVLAKADTISRAAIRLDSTGSVRAVGATSEDQSLRSRERDAVRQTLVATGGNVSEAARKLGISRSTLYRKMQQYGLD